MNEEKNSQNLNGSHPNADATAPVSLLEQIRKGRTLRNTSDSNSTNGKNSVTNNPLGQFAEDFLENAKKTSPRDVDEQNNDSSNDWSSEDESADIVTVATLTPEQTPEQTEEQEKKLQKQQEERLAMIKEAEKEREEEQNLKGTFKRQTTLELIRRELIRRAVAPSSEEDSFDSNSYHRSISRDQSEEDKNGSNSYLIPELFDPEDDTSAEEGDEFDIIPNEKEEPEISEIHSYEIINSKDSEDNLPPVPEFDADQNFDSSSDDKSPPPLPPRHNNHQNESSSEIVGNIHIQPAGFIVTTGRANPTSNISRKSSHTSLARTTHQPSKELESSLKDQNASLLRNALSNQAKPTLLFELAYHMNRDERALHHDSNAVYHLTTRGIDCLINTKYKINDEKIVILIKRLVSIANKPASDDCKISEVLSRINAILQCHNEVGERKDLHSGIYNIATNVVLNLKKECPSANIYIHDGVAKLASIDHTKGPVDINKAIQAIYRSVIENNWIISPKNTYIPEYSYALNILDFILHETKVSDTDLFLKLSHYMIHKERGLRPNPLKNEFKHKAIDPNADEYGIAQQHTWLVNIISKKGVARANACVQLCTSLLDDTNPQMTYDPHLAKKLLQLAKQSSDGNSSVEQNIQQLQQRIKPSHEQDPTFQNQNTAEEMIETTFNQSSSTWSNNNWATQFKQPKHEQEGLNNYNASTMKPPSPVSKEQEF